MDYAKAFTFARNDSDWLRKALIGLLMTILSPFVLPAFILLGYQLEITRGVMRGEDDRLPEWGDMSALLSEGFKLFVAQFAYALPVIALYIMAFIPVVIMADSNSDAAQAVGGIAIAGLGCAIFLMVVALVLLQPAVIIRYAETGDLASVFRVGEVWALARANIGDILMTVLVTMAASLALVVVIPLSIITCVGPFILMLLGPLWLTAGQYHMYGQIANRQPGPEKFKDADFGEL